MPKAATPKTKGSKIRKLIGMEMTLKTAEFVSWLSNCALIGALIFGVVSTYWIVVSGNVKEAALKADVASANERASDADKLAGEAKLKAAALESQAAQLQKQAEEARLETEKIKAQISWRTLSKEQFDIISTALKGIDFPIVIVLPAGNQEATAFGLQISKALENAGLKISITNVMGFGAHPRVGLLFSGTDAQLDLMQPAFAKASLVIQGLQKTDAGAQLEIGTNPPPSYQ